MTILLSILAGYILGVVATSLFVRHHIKAAWVSGLIYGRVPSWVQIWALRFERKMLVVALRLCLSTSKAGRKTITSPPTPPDTSSAPVGG
jgi:hypothetical protein